MSEAERKLIYMGPKPCYVNPIIFKNFLRDTWNTAIRSQKVKKNEFWGLFLKVSDFKVKTSQREIKMKFEWQSLRTAEELHETIEDFTSPTYQRQNEADFMRRVEVMDEEAFNPEPEQTQLCEKLKIEGSYILQADVINMEWEWRS